MSEQGTHIVELDKLEIGTYHFDYQLDNSYFNTIEKTELLGGNVLVEAQLDLRASDYDLHIKVHGVVEVTCDRCLDPMELPMEVDEDVDVEPGEKTLDLNWLAYELIIVNLPLVHSHQPGGCNPQMDALLQCHLCTSLEDEQQDKR